jgi:O-antigen ligase
MRAGASDPHALLTFPAALLVGASSAWLLSIAFAQQDTATLLATLAGLLGIALFPVLFLFLSRQAIDQLAWTVAVFALALTFIDNNFAFRENWPYTVLANGFRVSLSDLLLLFLALLWWFDRTYQSATSAIPKPLAIALVAMLLWDGANALLVAKESFFAWSLYWREIKAVFFLWILARYLRPYHLHWLGLALAAAVILEAIAVLDQRTVQAIFTEKLLKTEFALKSAAGSGYLLRFGGTFGHPNTLANFLAVALLYLWFFVPTLKGRPWQRAFVVFALIVGFATFTLTGSRAGWLGFGFALALGMLLWMKKNGKNVIIGALVMIFSVSAVFAALYATSATFRDRLTKDDRGSALVRIPLAETAANIIADRPLAGVGLGQYTREMHRYDRTYLQVASWYNQPVHNFALLTAAETGIPGLIVHLVVLALISWYGWQTFRGGTGFFADIGLTAMGGTLAWAIQEQANPDYIFMPYYLWVIWGAMLAARRWERQSRGETAK